MKEFKPRREYRRLLAEAAERARGVDEDAFEPTRPPGIDDEAILRVLRVPPELEGMRLDRFIPTQLRSTSRTRAQVIIDVSAFDETGRRLRSSDRVRAEQRICLWRPPLDEAPPPTEIRTLYEDEHLLVVDKPALMTVHPTARHHKHTLIKSLEASRPGEYLSLIHRLDRDTSGVVLVGKSVAADRAFKMQLEERSITAARAAETGAPVGKPDKIYLAVTWGVPPEGIIDLPLEEDPSPLRVKMRIAESGRGLHARTGVRVLARAGDYGLVRLELHTGRQHQIRVHLAHLGTTIVGDKLYGPEESLLSRSADNELTEEDLVTLELPRHALHAYQHRITHCFTGEELTVTAPFPEDLAAFWRSKGGELPEL